MKRKRLLAMGLSAVLIFQNSTFTGAGDLFTSEETDTGIMDIIDTPDSESGSVDDLDVYESFDYSQEEDILFSDGLEDFETVETDNLFAPVQGNDVSDTVVVLGEESA